VTVDIILSLPLSGLAITLLDVDNARESRKVATSS